MVQRGFNGSERKVTSRQTTTTGTAGFVGQAGNPLGIVLEPLAEATALGIIQTAGGEVPQTVTQVGGRIFMGVSLDVWGKGSMEIRQPYTDLLA